jgi:hypothetical protein
MMNELSVTLFNPLFRYELAFTFFKENLTGFVWPSTIVPSIAIDGPHELFFVLSLVFESFCSIMVLYIYMYPLNAPKSRYVL